MLDLTLSCETVQMNGTYVTLTKFSDPRMERINSFTQYFYIDNSSEYVYIYFELFKLYRCIFKYVFDNEIVDLEIVSNTSNEVLLRTDELEIAIDKIEELYIASFKQF